MSEILGDISSISGENRSSHRINSDLNEKDDSIPKAIKKSAFKITSVTKKSAQSETNADADANDVFVDNLADVQGLEGVDTLKIVDNYDTTPDDNYNTFASDGSVKEKIQDAGGPSRFKVVKIETTEPFRRGRWICHDFLNQPSTEKDRVDIAKTQEESHSENSSGSSSANFIQGIEEVPKIQPNVPLPISNSILPISTIQPHHSQDHSTHVQLTSSEAAVSTANNVFPESKQKPHSTQSVTGGEVENDFSGRISTPDTDNIQESQLMVAAHMQPSTVPLVMPSHTTSHSIQHTPLMSNQSSASSHISSANPSQLQRVETVQNPPTKPISSSVQLPQTQKSMQITALQAQKQTASVVTPVSDNLSTASSTVNPVGCALPPVSQNVAISDPRVDTLSANAQFRKVSSSQSSGQQSHLSDGVNIKAEGVTLPSGLTNGLSVVGANSALKEVTTDLGNGDAVRLNTRKTSEKITAPPAFIDPPPNDVKTAALATTTALLTPLAAGLGSSVSDKDSGGSGTITIDSRIEQAMDLVKSHLKFAVREEVDVLREQIVELKKKNTQLEQENNILKAGASPDVLAKLNTQLRPSAPPPSSTS